MKSHDLGCGSGRHAVELARRGYQVTGVDFSNGMLTQARKAAQNAKVEEGWIYCDVTQYNGPIAEFGSDLSGLGDRR